MIAEFRAGRADANAVVAAIRRNLLILPVTGTEEVMVGRASGANWLYAFTSRRELARFATARNENYQSWPFARVRGARLLDQLLRQLPAPCGVALDVAGPEPMLLPPVSGDIPTPSASTPSRIARPSDRNLPPIPRRNELP